MEPYFRDVADHLARVAEKVEGFDALLTDILTANLAQISILQNEESRQQNEDMRRISAWVALVAVGHRRHRHLRHELRQHARTAHPLRLLHLLAFMLVLDTPCTASSDAAAGCRCDPSSAA